MIPQYSSQGKSSFIKPMHVSIKTNDAFYDSSIIYMKRDSFKYPTVNKKR